MQRDSWLLHLLVFENLEMRLNNQQPSQAFCVQLFKEKTAPHTSSTSSGS